MSHERHALDVLLAKIDACADEHELEELLLEYTHAERGYGPWDWFSADLDQGIEDQRRILRHPSIGPRHLATLLGRFEEILDFEIQVPDEERDFPGHGAQLKLQQGLIDIVSDSRWNVDERFDYHAGRNVVDQWRRHHSHASWFTCGVVLGALSNPSLSGSLIEQFYDETWGWLSLDMDFNVLGRSVAELVVAHPNTPSGVIDGVIERIDVLFDDPASARSVLLSRGDLTAEQIAAIDATRQSNPRIAP